MRFGLDRMRRLLTALGSPQERFGAVHVVGTNGKSSTVRMTAAILRRHGLRAGAYLSPHLVSFTERVRVDDADVAPELRRRRRARGAAAEKVDRTLEHGDRVTQFELLTAAAYFDLAAAGVDVAVVEAGLGGRYDATNVLPSPVRCSTNVGLEHTRWLGPTVADIAAEKLDVVAPGATLVVGADLHPDAMALAERTAARARRASSSSRPPTAGWSSRARRASSGATSRWRARRPGLPRRARRRRRPRRRRLDARPRPLRVVDERPARSSTARTTPAAWPRWPRRCRFVGRPPARRVVAVLDDKDAAEMLRALLPLCDAVVITRARTRARCRRRRSPRSCRQLGGRPRGRRRARAALARARELAGPRRRRAGDRLDLPHRRPAAPGAARRSDAVTTTARGVRDDRRSWRSSRAGDPRLLRRRVRLRPTVPLGADVAAGRAYPASPTMPRASSGSTATA